MLFNRADIIAALMLMEGYTELQAMNRVDKAFPSLDAPSYCGGAPIYGRSGWNRYYIHNHTRGLYRFRISKMHITILDYEEMIAKAAELGLEIS